MDEDDFPNWVNKLDWTGSVWGIGMNNMAPYYGRYYDTAREGDVAASALEALEKGMTLDDLLKKNKNVKTWWTQHLKDRAAQAAIAARQAELDRKKAEKKKLEDEKRLEAVSKLTPEERAAFGLNAKGYHTR
jgi:hypothetical protein